MTANYVLVYDDYCALCCWYSGLFVRFGLLRAENRIPFSKADIDILTLIDIEKGKDEIPFIDRETGATLYGIDSLLEILGQKTSLVKSVGNFGPLKWFLQRLYKLVSYNRKVIVARKCGSGKFDCSPAFNVFYRVAFMVIGLVFNSLMLIPLHNDLFSEVPSYHLSLIHLEAAHLSFVTINCLIAAYLGTGRSIEYLGQVNMLALIATILLIPVIVINALAGMNESIIVICLFFLTIFITREYFRRMNYVNITSRAVVAINLICLVSFLIYVFH
jgi:hypothetical protein